MTWATAGTSSTHVCSARPRTGDPTGTGAAMHTRLQPQSTPKSIPADRKDLVAMARGRASPSGERLSTRTGPNHTPVGSMVIPYLSHVHSAYASISACLSAAEPRRGRRQSASETCSNSADPAKFTRSARTTRALRRRVCTPARRARRRPRTSSCRPSRPRGNERKRPQRCTRASSRQGPRRSRGP